MEQEKDSIEERPLPYEAGEDGIGYIPPTPQPEPEPEPDEEAALEDDPDGGVELVEVEIRGKRYQVPKEYRDGYLRHEDYTRKRQADADAIRMAQQMEELFQSPEGRKQLRAILDAQDGSEDRGDDDAVYLDPDLKEYVDRQLAAIREVLEPVREFLPTVQDIHVGRWYEQAARTVAERLGVQATPDAVRAAMESTGIPDPVGAFAAANFGRAVQSAAETAHQRAQAKPRVPQPSSAEPDYEKMDMMAQFQYLLRNGGVSQ